MDRREYYLAIVDRNDALLFDITLPENSEPNRHGDARHLKQFVVHSALDIIDAKAQIDHHMYLKDVDRFNEWIVSAFVTPRHIRVVLLHTQKSDDNIKHFLEDVATTFIKCSLNPLYTTVDLKNKTFVSKVLNAARHYLLY